MEGNYIFAPTNGINFQLILTLIKLVLCGIVSIGIEFNTKNCYASILKILSINPLFVIFGILLAVLIENNLTSSNGWKIAELYWAFTIVISVIIELTSIVISFVMLSDEKKLKEQEQYWIFIMWIVCHTIVPFILFWIHIIYNFHKKTYSIKPETVGKAENVV